MCVCVRPLGESDCENDLFRPEWNCRDDEARVPLEWNCSDDERWENQRLLDQEMQQRWRQDRERQAKDTRHYLLGFEAMRLGNDGAGAAGPMDAFHFSRGDDERVL